MSGLTRRQAQLLAFITEYDERHGICPSFQQMADGMGLASKSNIVPMVNTLVDKGKIRRLPGRARSIEVVTGAELAHISTLDLRRELNRRMGLAA